MAEAMNRHDLAAYLECFDPDYGSEQPLHPDRGFRGRERVERSWEWALQPGSDFRAAIVDSAVAGDTVWVEWRWTGTRQDGSLRDQRGVAKYRVHNGRVMAGRLYLEDADPGPRTGA
jgi:ketosteroid isomerase-like protein